MKNTRPQTIGVLSDTHLSGIDEQFRQQVEAAFSDCSIIIHAGDLTNRDVLEAFSDKELFAVHGNMCSPATRTALPESRTFTIGGYKFGLYHGDGLSLDIETGLITRFDDADCIVFGHTHRPLVNQFGSVLLINPGTFRGTGRYGSGGTYALISIDDHGLSAAIYSLKSGA